MKKLIYIYITLLIVFLSTSNVYCIESDEWKEKMNPRESTYIVKYRVKDNDSLYQIAEKYNTDIYTIRKLNWKKTNILKKSEQLIITRDTWLIHIATENDNFDSIAEQYKISKEELIKYNSFIKKWLNPWDKLFIHNWMEFNEIWEELLNDNSYKLTYVSNNSRFIKWNCTWFVAKYKNVDWSWNAKDWFKNAKNNNHLTWNEAKKWSIIVFFWDWYNKKYWHVWIVMDLNEKYLIIWDMNYRNLGEVSYRKVSINDDSIVWYIYN